MPELDQGTVVARASCPQCGGPIAYRVTRTRRTVMATCRNVYTEGPHEGLACNSQFKPGGPGSQDMIRAYQAAGDALRLDPMSTTTPTTTEPETSTDDQETDRPAEPRTAGGRDFLADLYGG